MKTKEQIEAALQRLEQVLDSKMDITKELTADATPLHKMIAASQQMGDKTYSEALLYGIALDWVLDYDCDGDEEEECNAMHNLLRRLGT